jgi:hypothetical protein
MRRLVLALTVFAAFGGGVVAFQMTVQPAYACSQPS